MKGHEKTSNESTYAETLSTSQHSSLWVAFSSSVELSKAFRHDNHRCERRIKKTLFHLGGGRICDLRSERGGQEFGNGEILFRRIPELVADRI